MDDRSDLERLRDVADMMCSAHAWLRDRFSRQSRALDVVILLLSAWVTVLGLAETSIAAKLAPFSLAPTLWAGCLGAGTFGLVLLQTLLDLRSSSDQHARAFDLYFAIRVTAATALADGAVVRSAEIERLEASKPLVVPVPDRLFIRAKQRHLRKLALSEAVSDRPFANLWLVTAKAKLTETYGAMRDEEPAVRTVVPVEGPPRG